MPCATALTRARGGPRRCSPHAPTPSWPPSMSTPDDPHWLAALVARSPVLPEAALREHWQTVIAWLPPPLRYELAGILMEVEIECRR